MPKKPKTQEMARAFLGSSIMYQGEILDVSQDLMFHGDEQVFYYYDQTSGAWRLIPIGDKDTGTQAKLFSRFLDANFPDVDANSNAIKELRSGVVRFIDNVFTDTLYDDHP